MSDSGLWPIGPQFYCVSGRVLPHPLGIDYYFFFFPLLSFQDMSSYHMRCRGFTSLTNISHNLLICELIMFASVMQHVIYLVRHNNKKLSLI